MKRGVYYVLIFALFLFSCNTNLDLTVSIEKLYLTRGTLTLIASLSDDFFKVKDVTAHLDVYQNNNLLYSFDVSDGFNGGGEFYYEQEIDYNVFNDRIEGFDIDNFSAVLTIETKKQTVSSPVFSRFYIPPKGIGGSRDDKAKSIVATTDGNLLIGGISYSSDFDFSSVVSGTGDLFLMKVSTDGDILWIKRYGDPNVNLKLKTLVKTFNGDGYVVLAELDYTPWIFKVDLNGDIIWQYSFDDNYDIDAIEPVPDGIVLGGYNGSEFYAKLSNSGTLMWTAIGQSNFRVRSLTYNPEQDIYVGLYGDSYDWGLTKLDPNGNIISSYDLSDEISRYFVDVLNIGFDSYLVVGEKIVVVDLGSLSDKVVDITPDVFNLVATQVEAMGNYYMVLASSVFNVGTFVFDKNYNFINSQVFPIAGEYPFSITAQNSKIYLTGRDNNNFLRNNYGGSDIFLMGYSANFVFLF